MSSAKYISLQPRVLLSVLCALALLLGWNLYARRLGTPEETQERVENILMNSQVFVTIARLDPRGFRTLKEIIEQMVSQGRTEDEIAARSTQVIRDLLPQYIARTSDWAINGYARALLAEALFLQNRDEIKCFEFLFPDSTSEEDPDLALPLIQTDLKRQLEFSLIEVIRDSIYKPQPPPDVTEMKRALSDIQTALRKEYGDDVELLQRIPEEPLSRKKLCQIGITLFEQAIALPSRESGLLLRYLLSGESAKARKQSPGKQGKK